MKSLSDLRTELNLLKTESAGNSIATAKVAMDLSTLVGRMDTFASPPPASATGATTVPSSPSSSTPSTSSLSLNDMTAEFKRREDKKLNIVISGLPSVPGKQDVELIYDLVNSELKFTPQITKTARLGSGKNGSPPLLLATLRDAADKRNIILHAKDLRSSSNAFVKSNVYINNDLTQIQRQENFALRGQLKARRATGELNLVIRAGKIVHNSSAVVSTTSSGAAATALTPSLGAGASALTSFSAP